MWFNAEGRHHAIGRDFADGAVVRVRHKHVAILVHGQTARTTKTRRIAFAIGSFSLPLTMAQLANLADRYVAANAARQGQFNHIVICGFAAAMLGVSFFRRAGFARAMGSADHV